jgi:hypothetical protein
MYAPRKFFTLNSIDCSDTLPKLLQLFDERFHEDIEIL